MTPEESILSPEAGANDRAKTAQAIDLAGFEYREVDWGDVITGTRAQLQGLGLGVGLAFPGETGGPKRRMTVKDPRGFEAVIEKPSWLKGLFCAWINFPGRPPRHGSRGNGIEVAPGVRRRELIWGDLFVGRAEDLVAAGLVQPDRLPGQPGMRKTSVRILPDGTVLGGPVTARPPKECDRAGAITISRVSKSTFQVSIVVSKEEAERRHIAEKIAVEKWQWKVRAMPRPRRLGWIQDTSPQKSRGHLRLVWSAA